MVLFPLARKSRSAFWQCHAKEDPTSAVNHLRRRLREFSRTRIAKKDVGARAKPFVEERVLGGRNTWCSHLPNFVALERWVEVRQKRTHPVNTAAD
jgi:hypothetical protein